MRPPSAPEKGLEYEETDVKGWRWFALPGVWGLRLTKQCRGRSSLINYGRGPDTARCKTGEKRQSGFLREPKYHTLRGKSHLILTETALGVCLRRSFFF